MMLICTTEMDEQVGEVDHYHLKGHLAHMTMLYAAELLSSNAYEHIICPRGPTALDQRAIALVGRLLPPFGHDRRRVVEIWCTMTEWLPVAPSFQVCLHLEKLDCWLCTSMP